MHLMHGEGTSHMMKVKEDEYFQTIEYLHKTNYKLLVNSL